MTARYTYAGEWFNSTIHRPTEDEALRNIRLGIDRKYDDIALKRRYTLDFDTVTWQLYLLMIHHAKRVFFDNDDTQRKRETEALRYCAKHMNLTAYDVLIYHAELCTIIARRRLFNLPDIPKTPLCEMSKHKSLVKRIQVAELEIA